VQERREHDAGVDHCDVDLQAYRLGVTQGLISDRLRRLPGDGGLCHTVPG